MSDKRYRPKTRADLVNYTLTKAITVLRSTKLVRDDCGDGKNTTDLAAAIADSIPHVEPYKGDNRGHNVLGADIDISAAYAKTVFSVVNTRLREHGYDNVHVYCACKDVSKKDMITFLKECMS